MWLCGRKLMAHSTYNAVVVFVCAVEWFCEYQTRSAYFCDERCDSNMFHCCDIARMDWWLFCYRRVLSVFRRQITRNIPIGRHDHTLYVTTETEAVNQRAQLWKPHSTCSKMSFTRSYLNSCDTMTPRRRVWTYRYCSPYKCEQVKCSENVVERYVRKKLGVLGHRMRVTWVLGQLFSGPYGSKVIANVTSTPKGTDTPVKSCMLLCRYCVLHFTISRCSDVPLLINVRCRLHIDMFLNSIL